MCAWQVVSTNLVLGTNSKDSVLAYQIVQSSQVMKVRELGLLL